MRGALPATGALSRTLACNTHGRAASGAHAQDVHGCSVTFTWSATDTVSCCGVCHVEVVHPREAGATLPLAASESPTVAATGADGACTGRHISGKVSGGTVNSWPADWVDGPHLMYATVHQYDGGQAGTPIWPWLHGCWQLATTPGPLVSGVCEHANSVVALPGFARVQCA